METVTLEKKIGLLSEDQKQKLDEFIDALLSDKTDHDKLNNNFKIKKGFGGAKGLIGYMADDFDAPLEDFKDYM